MSLFFTYLIQVNIALSLFYFLYTIVLKRDTFLRLRRLFFLSVVIFSLLYPFFTIPGLSDVWTTRSSDLQETAVTVMKGRPTTTSTVKSEKQVISGIPVHQLKKDITPFSFFSLIFIHAEKHSETELSQILLHEQSDADIS